MLLSQVLACDATVGFEDVTNEQVIKFNGQPVKNLMQLVRMIQAAEGEEFLVFDLDHDEVLVLDGKQVRTILWPFRCTEHHRHALPVRIP